MAEISTAVAESLKKQAKTINEIAQDSQAFRRWVLKSTSSAEQKEEKMADLVHYLKTKADLHCFFCIYFTCELLNWVHMILEIYVITWFFGFHMENYVSEYLAEWNTRQQ